MCYCEQLSLASYPLDRGNCVVYSFTVFTIYKLIPCHAIAYGNWIVQSLHWIYSSVRGDKFQNNQIQISIVALSLIGIRSDLSHCFRSFPLRPRNHDDYGFLCINERNTVKSLSTQHWVMHMLLITCVNSIDNTFSFHRFFCLSLRLSFSPIHSRRSMRAVQILCVGLFHRRNDCVYSKPTHSIERTLNPETACYRMSCCISLSLAAIVRCFSRRVEMKEETHQIQNKQDYSETDSTQIHVANSFVTTKRWIIFLIHFWPCGRFYIFQMASPISFMNTTQ